MDSKDNPGVGNRFHRLNWYWSRMIDNPCLDTMEDVRNVALAFNGVNMFVLYNTSKEFSISITINGDTLRFSNIDFTVPGFIAERDRPGVSPLEAPSPEVLKLKEFALEHRFDIWIPKAADAEIVPLHFGPSDTRILLNPEEPSAPTKLEILKCR